MLSREEPKIKLTMKVTHRFMKERTKTKDYIFLLVENWEQFKELFNQLDSNDKEELKVYCNSYTSSPLGDHLFGLENKYDFQSQIKRLSV